MHVTTVTWTGTVQHEQGGWAREHPPHRGRTERVPQDCQALHRKRSEPQPSGKRVHLSTLGVIHVCLIFISWATRKLAEIHLCLFRYSLSFPCWQLCNCNPVDGDRLSWSTSYTNSISCNVSYALPTRSIKHPKLDDKYYKAQFLLDFPSFLPPHLSYKTKNFFHTNMLHAPYHYKRKS